jgi:hypothetical protein
MIKSFMSGKVHKVLKNVWLAMRAGLEEERGGSKTGIERQKSMLALNESRIDVYVAFKPLFGNHIQQ